MNHTLGMRKSGVLLLLSAVSVLSVCLVESIAGLIGGLLVMTCVFVLQYIWWKQRQRRLPA
jgi:hypothetical protein